MQRLARLGANSETVRRGVLAILAECGDVLLCLDSWIRQHFVYRGEIEEIVRTPQFMLNELEWRGFFDGDCDDIATLYAALCTALGYRVRFVAIRYDETPHFKHVFIEAETPEGWLALDPTVQPGTVYTEVERMEVYI